MTANELNEEFFDLHPRPYDCQFFEINDKITVYLDLNNTDTWLVKIRFSTWQQSEKYEIRLRRLFENSNVNIYRSRKLLFLRRLLF